MQVKGGFSANNSELLHQAACAGMGIALLPSFTAGSDILAGRLVPLLQDYPVSPDTLYAVYPQSRYMQPKLRVMIDYLNEQFGPEPFWDEWSRHPG